NVRIICATRRDLLAEMANGRFREDLYFRLVVYPIEVPPLRERHTDIPLLVADTLRRLTAGSGRREARVAPPAMCALMRYEWPGNVRELINVIHRSLLLCHRGEITLADIPPYIQQTQEEPRADTQGLVTPLRELERSAIERALASA